LHYTAPACAFCVGNFFQLVIPKLKRLKRISVNFSFPDLLRIEEKLHHIENKGFHLLFVCFLDRSEDQISRPELCRKARRGAACKRFTDIL